MPTPDPSYREIQLTQGQVALVDAEDYESRSKHKWFAAWAPTTQSFYAVRKRPVEGQKQRTTWMHRVVLGLDAQDIRIGDHIDHNTLDNRKRNLRTVTRQQNTFNRKKSRAITSGYKGVHWRNDRCKWRAEIRIDGKLVHLGLFANPQDASKAYNAAAARIQGEHALGV